MGHPARTVDLLQGKTVVLFHHTGSYHLFLLREISKNHDLFSLVSTLETQHMWVAVFQYIQRAPENTECSLRS